MISPTVKPKEKRLSKLNSSASSFGGSLVNGKYSSYMFSSVDSKFTDANIRAEEEYSLTSETKVSKGTIKEMRKVS